MKRPADQTGFYKKLEEDKQNLLDADIALYIAIILIVLVAHYLVSHQPLQQ